METKEWNVEMIEMGTLLDGPEEDIKAVCAGYFWLNKHEHERYYVGENRVVEWTDKPESAHFDKKSGTEFLMNMYKMYPSCEMDVWAVRGSANNIVGYAVTRIHDYSKPKSIDLLWFWVDPQIRCAGVGSAILDAIKAFADKCKYAIFLTVATANTDARLFYQSRGFSCPQLNLCRMPGTN